MVYCGFTYSGRALMGIMHSILPTGKPVREMSRRYFLFLLPWFTFNFWNFHGFFTLTQFRLELQVINKIMEASKLKEGSGNICERKKWNGAFDYSFMLTTLSEWVRDIPYWIEVLRQKTFLFSTIPRTAFFELSQIKRFVQVL